MKYKLPSWWDKANCIGAPVEVFFPDTGNEATDEALMRPTAQRLCVPCPVRRECLKFAIRMKETDGLWGGLVPSERRALQ